jgi:hypothetical protein
MARPGRPSLFTAELAVAIFERLSRGESVQHLCRTPGMPHRATVHRWIAGNAALARLRSRMPDNKARLQEAIVRTVVRIEARPPYSWSRYGDPVVATSVRDGLQRADFTPLPSVTSVRRHMRALYLAGRLRAAPAWSRHQGLMVARQVG